jgi:hypothetical protein
MGRCPQPAGSEAEGGAPRPDLPSGDPDPAKGRPAGPTRRRVETGGGAHDRQPTKPKEGQPNQIHPGGTRIRRRDAKQSHHGGDRRAARDSSSVKVCEGEGKAKEERRRRANWINFGPTAVRRRHLAGRRRRPRGGAQAARQNRPESLGGNARGWGEKRDVYMLLLT